MAASGARVIVEDSPAVAEVHRRLVAAVPGFVVVGIAADRRRGAPARRAAPPAPAAARPRPSRTATGSSLLRALRGAREPVEVIAVTAARGAAVVRDCVHLGVVDYLVKPFAPERLRQALGLFAHRMQALRDGELAQAEVDRAVRQRAARRARAAPRPRTRDARRGARDAAGGGRPAVRDRRRRAAPASRASPRAATSSTSRPRAR